MYQTVLDARRAVYHTVLDSRADGVILCNILSWIRGKLARYHTALNASIPGEILCTRYEESWRYSVYNIRMAANLLSTVLTCYTGAATPILCIVRILYLFCLQCYRVSATILLGQLA